MITDGEFSDSQVSKKDEMAIVATESQVVTKNMRVIEISYHSVT